MKYIITIVTIFIHSNLTAGFNPKICVGELTDVVFFNPDINQLNKISFNSFNDFYYKETCNSSPPIKKTRLIMSAKTPYKPQISPHYS